MAKHKGYKSTVTKNNGLSVTTVDVEAPTSADETPARPKSKEEIAARLAREAEVSPLPE